MKLEHLEASLVMWIENMTSPMFRKMKLDTRQTVYESIKTSIRLMNLDHLQYEEAMQYAAERLNL